MHDFALVGVLGCSTCNLPTGPMICRPMPQAVQRCSLNYGASIVCSKKDFYEYEAIFLPLTDEKFFIMISYIYSSKTSPFSLQELLQAFLRADLARQPLSHTAVRFSF